MAGIRRRCATCRYFQKSGLGGNGWCTHPDRQESSEVRILVRPAELACRNAWGEDLWAEKLDDESGERHVPQQQPAASGPPAETWVEQGNVYDDEVTSVVARERHHHSGTPIHDDAGDVVVEQHAAPQQDARWQEEEDERIRLLAHDHHGAILRARMRHRKKNDPGVSSQPEDESTDEPRDLSTAPEFHPDDFVEDQAPSDFQPETGEDRIIKEDAAALYPRANRLRRERSKPRGPKPEKTAERESEDQPANLPQSPLPARDRFNSIPDIVSDVDLPLMRRSERPKAAPPSESATPVAETDTPYERALKRAREVKATARRADEREQRRLIEPHREDQLDERARFAAPPVPRSETLRSAPHMRSRQPGIRATGAATSSPTPGRGQAIGSWSDPRRNFWRGTFESDAPQIDSTTVPEGTRHDEVVADHAMAWQPQDLRDEDGMQALRERLFASDGADAHEAGALPVSEQSTDLDREPGDSESTRPPGRRETTYEPSPRAAINPGRRRNRSASLTSRQPEAQPEAAREVEETDIERWVLKDHHVDVTMDEVFDIRDIVRSGGELMDMTITVSPDVPRQCETCRSFRMSEQGGRGWCTNTWAFTHRQMVNASDLPCQSTIGCWWMPADAEVWFEEFEIDRTPTPRMDRMLHDDPPLRRANGE